MRLPILPVDAQLAAAPFETQVALTQIAMAVSPMGLVADMVCPRFPAPFKFAYTKLSSEDRLSAPDSRASRASQVNELEFGAADSTDSTVDWALACPVPQRDIEEAKKHMLAYDPLAEATDALATVMKINREVRVATLVTTSDSYAATSRTTLAGNAQWSHAGSNPLDAVLAQMDVPLVRPNTLVMGQQVWTKFRQHPKIVEAIKASGAGDQARGAVSRQQVAELFELDQVLIGRAQYQTAKPGQAATYAYIWGKHAALLHINRSASGTRSMMPSFCFTAEAMAMDVGTYMDAARGIGQGTTFVKASESLKELVSWQEAGYLWRSAVA